MIEIYKKSWYLLDKNERKQAIFLLMLMILTSVVEVIGVSSILPFLAVLGDNTIIQDNKYLLYAYNFFDFKSNYDFLIFLGISAFIILFISAIIKSITYYIQFNFSNMRRHSIGLKLLKRYLHQPYPFFLSRNSSEISKIILSEADMVIGQAFQPSLMIISYLLQAFAIITFLITVDFTLTLVLAGIFGTFYIIIYLSTKNYLTKIGKLRVKTNDARFKVISETIGGIKDLKVLGKEEIYLSSFEKPSLLFSKYNSNSSVLAQIPQFIIEVIVFGALLVMALYTLMNNSSSLGTLLPILGLYVLGAMKLKPMFSSIFAALTKMKFASSALDTVINDLKDNSNLISIDNDNKRFKLQDNIKFENISFSYPNSSRNSLENISFNIDVNSTVAIIGKTGSGKTTLIDLILGLLQPNEGIIKIDNEILSQKNVRQWQNTIGYVPQNIFLCDDTIASNIAFGIEKDKIDYTQVINVAKMAQVDEFVNTLDEKYDTIIGERGVRLSGGQRQRLGIARALYHNPQILILDEATSALDNETEKEVMKAIDNMNGNKTIIMIAHRLSTIENCDKIIKLEQGKIIHE